MSEKELKSKAGQTAGEAADKGAAKTELPVMNDATNPVLATEHSQGPITDQSLPLGPAVPLVLAAPVQAGQAEVKDKPTTDQDKPPAEPPAAAPPPKYKGKSSASLQSKLDDLKREQEDLAAERDAAHEDLVAAWGTKGVDSAASKVATYDAKLAGLVTVIERAQADYDQALSAERAAEASALSFEHAALIDRRKEATDALVAAQQGETAAMYEADQAVVNFSGLLSAASSALDPRIHTLDAIEAAYKMAKEAHKAVQDKSAALADVRATLRKAELVYLDSYHNLFVNERRAADLSQPVSP